MSGGPVFGDAVHGREGPPGVRWPGQCRLSIAWFSAIVVVVNQAEGESCLCELSRSSMARRLRVLEAIVKAADVEIFFSSWRHEVGAMAGGWVSACPPPPPHCYSGCLQTFGGRAVQQARMLASAACVSRVHTAAAGGTAATAIAPRRLPAALFSDSAAQQVDPAAASAEGSTPAASSAAAAGASKRAEDADERAGEAGPRSQLSAAARVYDSLHEPHEVMAEAQRQFDAGEFSTSEFASAVRRLVDMAGKQELTRASRGAFAELLDMVLAAADSGALVLDGKGTSYAIWGSTKLRLPPASPHLDRLLPLAAEHVGTMRFNDVATTVWALGELALKPDGALVEALFRQAEAVSATMRASNNIALLAGTTRLQLGEPYTQLVAGWLGQEPQLFARQIGNLANVLPMAGVKPGDPLAQLVFTQAEGQARWMDLVALTNIFWAAAKIGAELQPATMVALLHRLGRLAKFNRGRLVGPD